MSKSTDPGIQQGVLIIKVAQKEAKIYVRRHIKINWKKQVKEIDGHKRLLAIKEKALGPNHPDVAKSLNNLVRLYKTQGQHALAEPLQRRSQAIGSLRKLLERMGSDHPDVAKSLNNLAALYKTQGQYAQAEPLYKRSLAIAVQSLGPDHPAFALLRDAIRIILSSSFDVILRSFCMIAFG